MQYTSLVLEKELQIDNVSMMVRAHIIREKPRAFEDMIFEVRLEGSVSLEQVGWLAREASANCFVENTLARAIPLTTLVLLNGDKVMTLERGPDGARAASGAA